MLCLRLQGGLGTGVKDASWDAHVPFPRAWFNPQLLYFPSQMASEKGMGVQGPREGR